MFAGMLALLAGLTGCSSVGVELAPNASDLNAKAFQRSPGKAVLYVVQDGGYGSSRAMFQIAVDGRPLGSLMGYTYHRVILEAGSHAITATTPENERLLTTTLAADSVNFVGVSSSAGMVAMRVGTMRQLSEAEGQKTINESKMARGMTVSRSRLALEAGPGAPVRTRMTVTK